MISAEWYPDSQQRIILISTSETFTLDEFRAMYPTFVQMIRTAPGNVNLVADASHLKEIPAGFLGVLGEVVKETPLFPHYRTTVFVGNDRIALGVLRFVGQLVPITIAAEFAQSVTDAVHMLGFREDSTRPSRKNLSERLTPRS